MAVGNGISLFPWRGPKWSGVQTNTPSDHGEHQFVRIVGGYVVDQEIRTFPGWKCVLNPTDNGPGLEGYKQLVVDSERPCAGPRYPADVLRDRVPFNTEPPAVAETIAVRDRQKVWAEPRHMHAFFRVREKLVLIAESGLRIEPILDTATGLVISVMSAWERAAGFAVIVLSPIPGAVTAGFCNQIAAGYPLWIDTVVDAGNPTDAARLSRRVHYVTAYDAATGKITLNTTVAAAGTLTNLTVQVGRCRGNQSGSFGPDGRREFGESDLNAILDDESLTAYWVEDMFDLDGVPIQNVYASYIANRQRDYGDDSAVRAGVGAQAEGHRSTAMVAAGIQYGVPRRRTMRLPMRVVPHLAGDRILIAAPGYGCLLQIPAVVPTTSSTSLHPTIGAAQNFNATWARPRSLGIPKGQLAVTPTLPGVPLCRGIIGTSGFPAGEYTFAIAYRDDSTGEIGQMSEPWTINSDNQYARGDAAAGCTNIVFSTTAPFPVWAVNELIGFSILWTSGAQTGQTGVITANTANTVTIGVAIAGAPAAGDTFIIRGGSLTLRLAIMHPGYALCETMALSVMVYMTRVGEKTLLHVATIQPNDDRLVWTGLNYDDGASASSVYGLPGTSAPTSHEMFWFYSIPAILKSTPKLYNANVELPEFRTMPRGASWVRVIRGVRVSGGSIGNVGSKKELLAGIGLDFYTGPNGDEPFPNQLTVGRTNGDGVWTREWPFVGSRLIPDSYGGCQMWSPTIWPHPMEIATLDRLVNCHSTLFGISTAAGPGSTERHYSRWHILENPHRWDGIRIKDGPAYLVMPRGQIQIGEPGLHSVQFAQGIQLVDSNKDEDTVAGGEFRGVVLMMTQKQTYALSWQQGPAGALPSLLAPEIGCIAPNAVVEHNDAALWIADQGPVECNGQVGWTGRQIEQWFRGSSARFLRDGEGMMRHSFGAHDENRGLVYLGVIENRNNLSITFDDAAVSWANASTNARSRFPCDTVLTYNPGNGQVSEWQPPVGLEALWMGPVSCTDGQPRMGFLAADKRLYVLDDAFGEGNKETIMCPSLVDASNTTQFLAGICLAAGVIPGTDNASRGGLGSHVRVGMDVCIYDATTFALKHRSTIAALSNHFPDYMEITLATAGTWTGNDIALIGGRTMTIETTYVSPKGADETQLEAIAIKAALFARSNDPTKNVGYMEQPVWVKVTVTHSEHQSGRHGGGTGLQRSHSMHRAPLGDFVGKSDIGKKVDRIVRCASGRVNAVSFKVTVELFGGAQVCLQDLLMEVG